jgi:hypothetical protein
MIRNIFGMLVALSLLSSCSLTQSPPTCVIGQGVWFAKYTLKANQPAGLCSQKTGEGLGVRKYFPNGRDPLVAIRSDTLGALVLQTPGDPNPSDVAESTGALSQSAPNSDTACIIPTLSKAEQNVGGSDIAYEWSNVKFIVESDVPGTQLMATLRYTEGGCTAEYKVVAMQPNADCFALDAQGNQIFDTQGNGIPDNTRCGPGAFPQGQVNPDFDVRCDPDLLKCVLRTDPPSLLVR